MKGTVLFVKQSSFIPFLLGLIAIVFLFAYESWLIEIPQKFSGGYVLGKILNGIALSYVAAYIFLIVVVEWPKFKEKKKILPFIFNKVDAVNGFNESIKNRFSLEPNNWNGIGYDAQIAYLEAIFKKDYWLENNLPLVGMDFNQDAKNKVVEKEIRNIVKEIEKIKSGITYASIHTQYLNAELVVAIEELQSVPLFVGSTALQSLYVMFDGMFDEKEGNWDFNLFIIEVHSLIVMLDNIYRKFKKELEPFWELKYRTK